MAFAAACVRVYARTHMQDNEERNIVGIRSRRAGMRASWAVLMCAVATSSIAGFAQTQQPAQPARLTLREAVAQGLQHSRDISLAQLRYQLAQRESGLTASRFLPNLYAGSGAAYTSGFPLLAGGGAPALFSMTYNQSLFDLPARGELRVAQQRTEQQRLQVDAVRDTVIVRVASLYLELAKVRRELDLLHREVASTQQILNYTENRLNAGLELPIERTKAQLGDARVKQRVAQYEDQEDLLADQLGTLLGFAPEQHIEVVSEDIPPVAVQSAADLVKRALENNVEIRQAESERVASVEHLRGERGGYWPTVAIIGQYNVLGKFNNYDQFFNKFQRNNAVAGVELRIPIFAASTRASVAAAAANVTTAQMALDNKRVEVSSDVRRKARQTRQLEMSREVARLELQLAQDSLQVLQAQMQQGRASIRDMETAQLEENDKWLAFLDADFARQQAQLDLLRTTGEVASAFQ